jgi:hypothetical protein
LKHFNVSQPEGKRPISVQKVRQPPAQVLNPQSRSPQRQVTTANRLIQKRQSVERKLEEMRKQKIEAELKEVQAKPRISSRSRKLAEKAEIKILNIIKPKEVLNDRKFLCDDEMIELEQDIQLIEDCLNMKDHKSHVQTFDDKKVSIFDSLNSELEKKDSLFYRASKNDRKSEGKVSSNSQVKRTQSTIRSIPVPIQRKFIKSRSPTISKQRSNSMESLQIFQFGYRSLSPYQITIKRNELY